MSFNNVSNRFYRKLKKLVKRLWRNNVLGMNWRNREIVTKTNKPAAIRLVNHKYYYKKICNLNNIPTPKTLAVVTHPAEMNLLWKQSVPFVIKPIFGSRGRGIEIFEKKLGENYVNIKGELWTKKDIRRHVLNILQGKYSMSSLEDDMALIEDKISFTRFFSELDKYGVPDLRVLVYKGIIIGIMLRVPNELSWGTANLSQGADGISIDMDSSFFIDAYNKICHCRHGVNKELYLPMWDKTRYISLKAAYVSGLAYAGVDLVYTPDGPIVVECNARAGIEIQNVMEKGLFPIIQEIEKLEKSKETQWKAEERWPTHLLYN